MQFEKRPDMEILQEINRRIKRAAKTKTIKSAWSKSQKTNSTNWTRTNLESEEIKSSRKWEWKQWRTYY